MYSGPRPVSNISNLTFRFPALESKESLGRHGLNERRLMSISVAWLELTNRAEMHGEQVFDETWCWQNHNLKMGMDGWTNAQPMRWRCVAHYLQDKYQRSMSHGSLKVFLSCALLGSVPISRICFIYMVQINSPIDTQHLQFKMTKTQECTNRSYLKWPLAAKKNF